MEPDGTPEPALWPPRYRAVLCLTVVLDGPPVGANGPATDDHDGPRHPSYLQAGVGRLLDVFADADVSATFCFADRIIEDRPELVRRIAAAGHEAALYAPDDPAGKAADQQPSRRDQAARALAGLSGTRPTGWKAAAGVASAETLAVLSGIGLTWAMDDAAADRPDLLHPDSGRTPLVRIPAARWFDDRPFADHAVIPRHAFETWREDLDVLRGEGGLMVLSLHPEASGRPGASRAVARLIDHAIDLGDVWIARADQIAGWWIQRPGQRATPP